MKRHVLNVFAVAVTAAALCFAGCSSASVSPAGLATDGEAIVQRFTKAPVCLQDGFSNVVTRGMRLHPGATIITDAGSRVWLHPLGTKSTILIEPSSEIEFTKMKRSGVGRSTETETLLNLKKGSLIGQVKTRSKYSSYQIRTPNTVASVREAVFRVKIEPGKNGAPKTTFLCGEGKLRVAAETSGKSNVVDMAAAEVCVSELGSLERTLALPEDLYSLLDYGGMYVPPPQPPPSVPFVPPFNGNGPPRLIASGRYTGPVTSPSPSPSPQIIAPSRH